MHWGYISPMHLIAIYIASYINIAFEVEYIKWPSKIKRWHVSLCPDLTKKNLMCCFDHLTPFIQMKLFY